MGLAANQAITDIRLDRIFIGSCTNSRIEDLRAADFFIVAVPTPVDRANKLWGFDSDGNFTVASDTGGSTAAAAASALAAQGYAADAAASEAAAVAAAASVNLPASPVAGDMLTHNGTAFTRLAKGTALQILRMNAGATSQEYFTMNLPPTPGAAGDIIYWNGSAWTKLAVGTALQVLRTNSGATAPEWASFSGDFSTGDFKLTLKTTADSGWVMCNDGTIGNGSSGGTTRANADTSALFTLLWNNVSDTYAPVSTGRGASAAADFAANKTIGLTKMLGRALAIAGAGSGLTSRVLGLNLGEETHTTPTAELPAHAHDQQISNAGASGAIADFVYWTGGGAVSGRLAPTWGAAESTGLAVATKNAGSGTPQNIMQPTSFVNIMLKL
jgi:microcystin-dependent protein